MSLCADYDAALHDAEWRQHLRRKGYLQPALVVYEAEHVWRQAGEYAIRAEMERLLEIRWPGCTRVVTLTPKKIA